MLILRIPCFLSVLFPVILELSSEQVWTMHGYNGCKDSHFRIQFLPGLRLIAIFPCHILHAKRAIPSLALHTLSSLFRSIIYWFFKKNPIASFSLSYSECSLVVALYFGLFIFLELFQLSFAGTAPRRCLLTLWALWPSTQWNLVFIPNSMAPFI